MVKKLITCNIQLNAKVTAIKDAENGILVETIHGETLQADKAVICIPPQLALHIELPTELPSAVRTILSTVQTWMAGAVKFVVEYAAPFWRRKGLSGMLYSHADIVVEMYDHTHFDGDKYGFTGFLNGGAAQYTTEVRRENVLRQLKELFGDEAAQPVAYFDKAWNDEFIQYGNQIIDRPHQNNGHPLLQEHYMNGQLFFCGTETASVFPGYMEGAVEAAIRVAESIK